MHAAIRGPLAPTDLALRSASTLALAVSLALVAPAPTSGQTADFMPEAARGSDFPLSIRSIMRGPELVGQSPNQVRWSPDGDWIYFRWLPGGGEWDAERKLWRVRADGSGLEEVDPEADPLLDVRLANGDLSEDGRRKLVSQDGDLFLVDVRSGEVEQLTDTQERETGAAWMADGAILYRSGTNLFRMQEGRVTQLTDIRTGNGPRPDQEAEGHRAFLEEQQLELFEHIRRGKARADSVEARRERATADEAEPFFVPQGQQLGQLAGSSDGRYAVLSTFQRAAGARQTMVPDWVTESGYTEELNVRAKVGDQQNSTRVGLLNAGTGEATWLEAAPRGYEGEANWSLNVIGWNDAGTHGLLLHRVDDDTRWVLSTLDAATGELTHVAEETNEAWVGGACRFGCVGWLPNRDAVYYVSEETGYAHVYTVNADGSGMRQLTSGEWEVLSIDVVEGQDRFFIGTNEFSPFDQHMAFMSFDGEREYLTAGEGRYTGTLSPDGRRVAVIHDVANRPQELFATEVGDLRSAAREVARTQGGDGPARMARAMARVTDSPTDEWKSFDWVKPEIVRFQARDGARVPARIYRPEDVGGTANGAAVVFVHGAGYLHNVHNYWSSYYREYMFHHLLAAQGYTVMDIDYRGSAGYGAEWRTGIYRFMGGKDLTDQEDGARWLVANEGIDAGRIGIYGGSYGGFITLMALTTGDQLFKSGAALRSVTDWAHYNDGYTSNILNDPQEDREAYIRSSPIYHVENFRDDQHMLILHGMIDTNVHFSDVVRYAQRLIELGKENWEFAVYPVENHGFVEPSSWTDEYRRIFELFERTLARPGCTDGGALCAVPGR